ncbi:acyl-[ACP]--phospholipid O-acyltransferase [Teredinibacter sp. KSP-S5-2]|uniref:acyl-[ACP]--phospholipid O-acyltransferase n=1 Tax=Teredinibacter sp. KSP-S5-2 TaxID=3034506 RepID=UPI0029346C63|nr:acyl-[ACP]--phospholipid O-acyltransferase [Teredinibacter sp. KSP-S5-2]WNO08770.1 acyl-[ACP]--phospholipid O-acyltransferase [Teredinibacter sp. KSP-S5-2]
MQTSRFQSGAIAFFVAVFLNAFVDLGHKITIQNILFKVYDGPNQVILTAVLNALILLPFILLFSPAGLLSDKKPKTEVMRITAWAGVGLTIAITLCYAVGWFWLAFAMTFLLAVQSAFYSPAKYGFIKSFFGKEKLASANGSVQTISIIAILAGTFIFSILFEVLYPEGVTDKQQIIQLLIPIGALLVVNATLELIMVYLLPTVSEELSDEPFDAKRFLTGRTLKADLKPLFSHQVIWLSVIGLSVFWAIGQVMLAAFPSFVKAELQITNTIVIQAILAATGIGIALGAMFAGRFSKGYIETGLIPLGAVGIAIGVALIPSMSSVTTFAGLFFLVGFMGGIFIVPLNAIIQFHAKESELGRVLAGNNLFQNIFMFSFLVLTAVFSLVGLESKHLFYITAVVAAVGCFYTIKKLPQSLVRFVLTLIMTRPYKVVVQGMKDIPEKGGVLLLGNHISWVDWAIIQIAYPRQVHFVMAKSIYSKWYIKWFLDFFGCIPIAPGKNSKKSLEQVAELLNDGKVVCLFPEGMISKNGHLAEFKRGFEQAAQQANPDVVIQPFYLRGLWGSRFSRASAGYKRNRVSPLRREVIASFGKPMDRLSNASQVKQRVFDLSVLSWNNFAEQLPTITHAWVNQCKSSKSSLCMADEISGELSNSKALTGAITLAQKVKRISHEQNVGVMLPTSVPGMLMNMAVLLCGKTVVNLNYTASAQAVESAVEQAEIKTIYTSKRFVNKLEKRGIQLNSVFEKVNTVYLEEMRETISPVMRIVNFLSVILLPGWLLKILFCPRRDPESLAAILFSSGSEGAPKGVQLSHKNVMANLRQVADVLNSEGDDVITASLPLFHAFGMTVTQFMPLLEGIPVVCHPDPTDALGLGKLIAKYEATVLFGTSTFYRIYARNTRLHPLMFKSLKFIVSGAERLDPKVRHAFSEKFNKYILEGYGVTETTPVAAVNLPDQMNMRDWRVQKGGKPGTVGMPLPGTSFKIVDPETFEELPAGEDGMILIGGAQVMKGYLNNPEKTESVVKIIDGMRWYVSGDKGNLDEDGYLTIVDRYSRFAKLGGEMVSLSEVERSAQDAFDEDDLEFVAVNLPDDKKGEKIILLTDSDKTLEQVREKMLQNKCNPLHIPSAIVRVEEMPKLGSGKTDFTKAKELAVG